MKPLDDREAARLARAVSLHSLCHPSRDLVYFEWGAMCWRCGLQWLREQPEHDNTPYRRYIGHAFPGEQIYHDLGNNR